MPTILQWYQEGGPFIVPLLVVGAGGLLLLAERLNYIVLRSRTHARPFIERVISLVRDDQFDAALKLCVEHQSALPDLGLVILRSRAASERDLLSVADTATLNVVPALVRRLGWLRTLVHVALLLGVLGFVANLHDGLAAGAASAETWRGALTYALRPLGVGILTAIPLLAGHAYLVHEADKISAHLEEFAARLVNAMIDRPDVRLGHRD